MSLIGVSDSEGSIKMQEINEFVFKIEIVVDILFSSALTRTAFLEMCIHMNRDHEQSKNTYREKMNFTKTVFSSCCFLKSNSIAFGALLWIFDVDEA